MNLHLANTLRYLGYGLLGVLALELAARIDDYQRYRAPLFGAYSINTIFESSPYGRSGVPGARFAKWALNSGGYRGPEPVAGRVNVVVFGASETFGLYESPGREYPRVLEDDLNAHGGTRYNVINIAIPGISIGRVDYLDHALVATRAKYLVVYPAPANYIGRATGYCGQPAVPVPVQLRLDDRVRLAGKVTQLLKAQLPVPMATWLRRLSIWRATRREQVMSRVPQATIDAFSGDLRCVIEHARAQRVEPVLLTHATWFHGTAETGDMPLLTSWRRFYPQLSELGFLDLEDRANQEIRAAGQSSGVKVIDAANRMPRGSCCFADFVHFNDAGAARMAQLIAAELETDSK